MYSLKKQEFNVMIEFLFFEGFVLPKGLIFLKSFITSVFNSSSLINPLLFIRYFLSTQVLRLP